MDTTPTSTATSRPGLPVPRPGPGPVQERPGAGISHPPPLNVKVESKRSGHAPLAAQPAATLLMKLSSSSSSFTSPDLDTATADTHERRAKRQKVAAACDDCRARKVKCDGSKPVCTPCGRKYGPRAVCEWGVRRTRSTGASKLEIMRLQSRIAELERSNQESLRDGDGDGDGDGDRDRDGRTIASSPVSEEMSPSSNRHGHGEGHDSDANAMMGLMEEARHSQANNPVGDSSAASFMSRIKSVLDQQSATPDAAQRQQQPPSSTGPALIPQAYQPSRRTSRRPDYVLPSREQADHLLQVYWRLVDCLYPFLDRDDFTTKYLNLWTGHSGMEDENGFVCLINAVFGIASNLDCSIPPADRISAADVFYRRAQLHMGFDLLQSRSVQTVQCFLLLGQYLQSTNDPQGCWVFTGLAIRIAQSLGLDLPSTSMQQTQDPKRSSELRKVWHGCVLMDRTLSMTFGRPAVITSEAATSVPSPLTHPGRDGHHAECSCHRELCKFDPESPDLHFFIDCLKLYEVMGETLLALYSPVPESEGLEDCYGQYFGALGAKAAGTVLEIDSKFGHWRRGLPLHLRYGAGPEVPKSRIHVRQTNVLWARYCHIRTLLFRPVLSRFCTANEEVDAESTLARTLALQCAVMCVRSALDTLNLFGPILEECKWEELDEILPAWWYCVFYLYTAATVLVAARLNKTVEAEVGREVVMNASRVATAALNHYQIFGRHAKRCAAAVSLLFDQLPSHHQQQQQTQHGHQVEQGPSFPSSRMQSGTLGGPGPQMSTALSPAYDQSQRWETWSSHVLRDRNRLQSATGSGNGSEEVWIYDQHQRAPNEANPGYFPQQHAAHPSVDMLDASDLRFDLGGDMSWLSSIPFELYSEY